MIAQTLAAAVFAVTTIMGPVPPGVTSGVDISGNQAGIDFSQVGGFAVVKEGGSQLAGGPYVSTSYAGLVAGARAQGLHVGHYWLSGDFLSPTASADYFVDHLVDYRPGDVLALDDEILDDSTRLWNDADVAAFFTRVHERVGDHVPWLYIGAANLRSQSWPQTIATGTKLWVASWGANDGTYPGEPDIGSAYPAWSVHQYTSNGSIGGIRTDLDVAKADAFDVVTPGTPVPPAKLPKTSTESDGIPGPIMWKRTQNWLHLEQGYAGPIDGVPGVNTYAALQRAMRSYGYTGPIDGVPGTNTWAAVQRLGQQWGYTGPVDGVLGVNSWRAYAKFVNQDKYD